MLDPPDGFAPLFRTSPFLDVLGPFYHRRDGRALILGVRIAEKHCNARGTAHGGLLMTLADIANAYLSVGDERIVRASAVFVRGGRAEA